MSGAPSATSATAAVVADAAALVRWPVQEICVSQFLIEEVNKKPHTLYRVEVKSNIRSFSIDKRFKDFEMLHADLRRRMNLGVEFPQKHLYTRTVKTFEHRRSQLDAYMKRLTAYFDHKLPAEMVTFFGLDDSLRSLGVGRSATAAMSLGGSAAFTTVSGTHGATQQAPDEDATDSTLSDMSNRMPSVGIKDASANEIVNSLANISNDIVMRGVLMALYS